MKTEKHQDRSSSPVPKIEDLIDIYNSVFGDFLRQRPTMYSNNTPQILLTHVANELKELLESFSKYHLNDPELLEELPDPFLLLVQLIPPEIAWIVFSRICTRTHNHFAKPHEPQNQKSIEIELREIESLICRINNNPNQISSIRQVVNTIATNFTLCGRLGINLMPLIMAKHYYNQIRFPVEYFNGEIPYNEGRQISKERELKRGLKRSILYPTLEGLVNSGGINIRQ